MNRPSISLQGLARLFYLSLLGGLLGACTSGAQFTNECQRDLDCPPGAFCKISAGGQVGGICACRPGTTDLCAEGEICNNEGVCQKRTACRSNVECDSDKYCDLSTGNCIERTSCGTDVHCLPGTVCDPGTGACATGCNDNGDCPLYQICDFTVPGSVPGSGTCIAGRCDDKSFCDYGSICQGGSCIQDGNPSHCAECGQGSPCPTASDFCLINSSYIPGEEATRGGPNFCAAECSSEVDCPSGYGCGGVVLLTQDQCTNDNECGGGGRQCVLGEGDLRGFCTCINDQDCNTDSAPPACLGSCGGLGLQACQTDNDCAILPCETNSKQCQWPQGRACQQDADCDPLPLCADLPGVGQICVTDGVTPCQTSADCQCANGTCAFTGRPCGSAADCNLPCQGGGCVLGAACAPIQGLLCPDVR